jgi:hypothetical protein
MASVIAIGEWICAAGMFEIFLEKNFKHTRCANPFTKLMWEGMLPVVMNLVSANEGAKVKKEAVLQG